MFENLFSFSQGSEPISWGAVAINLVLALILSWVVSLAYRKTHKGLSYSQSFTFTIIFIGFLIAAIMMVIGNSVARAFGAFGAFSLIRFRTAIKDTKDISYILLVMAIGLAIGTGNQVIAIVITVLALTVIYILAKVNFGSIRNYDFIINFSADTDKFSNEKMRELFREFLKFDNLLNVVSRENGQVLDYSFNIRFIKSGEMEIFVKKLDQLDGVTDVDIISAKNDIEY